MTTTNEQIALLSGKFTQANLDASTKVRLLEAEYNKLPRKDSFSGLSIAEKIEKAEGSKDFIGHPAKYTTDLSAIWSEVQRMTEVQKSYFQSWLHVTAANRGIKVCELTASDWCAGYIQTKDEVMQSQTEGREGE